MNTFFLKIIQFHFSDAEWEETGPNTFYEFEQVKD